MHIFSRYARSAVATAVLILLAIVIIWQMTANADTELTERAPTSSLAINAQMLLAGDSTTCPIWMEPSLEDFFIELRCYVADPGYTRADVAEFFSDWFDHHSDTLQWQGKWQLSGWPVIERVAVNRSGVVFNLLVTLEDDGTVLYMIGERY